MSQRLLMGLGDDAAARIGKPVAAEFSALMTVEGNRTAFAPLPEARGERTGRLDYVACWYAKAIAYGRGHKVRSGFVSTNSVTQGDQARALDPIFRAAGL